MKPTCIPEAGDAGSKIQYEDDSHLCLNVKPTIVRNDHARCTLTEGETEVARAYEKATP